MAIWEYEPAHPLLSIHSQGRCQQLPSLLYEDENRMVLCMEERFADQSREAAEDKQLFVPAHATSLAARQPVSVGGVIAPITSEDDVLGEMLDNPQDALVRQLPK